MRDNAEFFASMKSLIDRWCDRRALAAGATELAPENETVAKVEFRS